MKLTCVQCRTRKVRCDGQHDTCGCCQRLRFDCSFGHGLTPTRVSKLRTRQACSQCRSQKIKCSGETPHCANCVRRQKVCSFVKPETVLGNFNGSDSFSTSRNARSRQHEIDQRTAFEPPTGIELSRMIEDYFQHVHALSMTAFLHPPTTKQRCVDDTLDAYLQLSICAVTALKLNIARYYPGSTTSWIEQAENMIWREIETPSVSKIQALLLILTYRIESDKPAKAFMLAAIAARMSTALHLNYENRELGAVAREVRRRIVWTLAVMDGYFAIGVPEYEVATFENVYLQLPCTEEAFEAGLAVRTEGLRPSGRRHLEGLDCMGFAIRLASMRRDIMRLNRQLALSDQPVPDLEDMVRRFSAMLSQIESDLNLSYAYSKEALMQYISTGSFTRYITAHLSLHQAFCDLHRIFLRDYPEAAPEVVLNAVSNDIITDAARTCLQHAAATITILQDVQECCKIWALLEVDNAICAYHAARLAVFIPKTGLINEPEIAGLALQRANSCLRFACHFFESCSFAEPIITELEQLIIQESSSNQDFYMRTTALSMSNLNQWNINESALPRESQKHQRLAIHSLLRRSQFIDENTELELSVSSPASTFHTSGYTGLAQPTAR